MLLMVPIEIMKDENKREHLLFFLCTGNQLLDGNMGSNRPAFVSERDAVNENNW